MGSGRTAELGDSCAFCVGCGWGRRFMSGTRDPVPARCPDCGGDVLAACPACGSSIASLMAITCRACGTPLRDDQLFGVVIRRKPERHAVAPDCAGEAARAVDAEGETRTSVSSP